jgi:hypothetical protein
MYSFVYIHLEEGYVSSIANACVIPCMLDCLAFKLLAVNMLS